MGADHAGPDTRSGRPARLHRPAGLVQQTRQLFWLASLFALAITLPGLYIGPDLSGVPLGIGSLAVLAVSWTARYLTGRVHGAAEVVEVAAAVAVVVCAPAPAAAFIGLVPAVLFRGLYGSVRRLLAYTLGLGAGQLLALPLWERWHGISANADAVYADLGFLLLALVVAAVGAFLSRSMQAREQARLRDVALVQLGNQLIGVVDLMAIRSHAHACLETICRATPGLQALMVRGSPDGFTVIEHAGGVTSVPTTVALSDLYAVTGVEPAGDGAAPAPNARWLGVRTTEEAERWVLLTGLRRIPDDVVVAVQSMLNIVMLAMNTSDAHQDLTLQANTDALTGLTNRAAFARALDAALADPDGSLAVMFIDLDDFKIVNDGLGHAAGDELLRHVAGRLRSSVRPDDLCARLGGDEFAILLPRAGDGADATAQRLVELVSTPVSLRGHKAQVGASVGLAFAATGSTAELLMQQADIAMYAAKARGKNRVQVFDPSLLQDDGRSTFVSELATAADAGQLVVHYQPIMSVADGRCIGVEALVRWQHPRRGLLGPAEFIPVAERTGAIIAIGTAVLRTACAQARTWPSGNGRLALHVNVSAAQLTDPGFFATVRECVADGFGPKQLVLEITESMVLESPAIRDALDALVATGVALAIDDFGTGYSVLTALHTLPLDIVKIDKSFIVGESSRTAEEAVVGGIVQMARGLGLQVIAEGVERVDQQAFLRTVGVDAAQGFLHLRPTPAPEFATWLRRQQRARIRPAATVTPLRTRSLP